MQRLSLKCMDVKTLKVPVLAAISNRKITIFCDDLEWVSEAYQLSAVLDFLS